MELVPTPALTQLPFAVASHAYLETRRPYLSAKTFYEYQLNLKTLSAFFGELRLPEIDGDLVRAYQRMRQQKCGAFAINHECGLLCQIRKRIGMPLVDYQPLPMPKEMRGQVLSDEQRARLFRIGSEHPEWEAIYLLAILCINTTANPKEGYALRFMDVNLETRLMRVREGSAKNEYRYRDVPLNDEAIKAVKQAMSRAKRLAGAGEPEHHLFPFRVNKGNHYDPARHQTTFKTAWGKWREEAGIPRTFRIEDFRHHALTGLYQDARNSDETIQAIAGHHDRRMRRFYSHIRIENRRAAVAGLAIKTSGNMRERRKKKRPQKSTGEMSASELLTTLAKLLKAG